MFSQWWRWVQKEFGITKAMPVVLLIMTSGRFDAFNHLTGHRNMQAGVDSHFEICGISSARSSLDK